MNRAKFIALLALLLAATGFEYALAPRAAPPAEPSSLDSRLLPSAVGSFRAAGRWSRQLNPSTLEAGASYRSGNGIEVALDLMLGSRAPHNAVQCLLVRGYPLRWQRLRRVRTAAASAVFDTALFQDDNGRLLLLANTECYRARCGERVIPREIAIRWPVFPTPGLTPANAPVPVSIEVRELSGPPAEDPHAAETRLIGEFERFAAALDLSGLHAPDESRAKEGEESAQSLGATQP